MKAIAKEYKASVIEVLMRKYNMNQLEAEKAIRQTFLQDSLLYFPEETIHDDIETTADEVYEDYVCPAKMRM